MNNTTEKDYTMIKDDYFDNGTPVHKVSYCAFLDVLGFSNRLLDSYRNGTEDQLLNQFHNIISNTNKTLKTDTNESKLYYKSFTDNVIIAHPQFSKDMESEFAFVMWSVNEYQFKMALEGFFVRGGIALDKLFIDENSVYGAALIKSYQLESKAAKYPIVVLCEKTIERVENYTGFYSSIEACPLYNDVLIAEQNIHFINYLTECINTDSHVYSIYHNKLLAHKKQIELALSLYSADAKVIEKFEWLAGYHNFFCDTISQFPDYTKDLKLDGVASLKLGRLKKTSR